MNTASQTIASGSSVNLGSIIRRFGSNINSSGGAVTVSGMGYYDVIASVTGTATTAGTITATLYKDGVAVAGATETTTVSAVGDYFALDVDAIIREMCCESSSNLTVVISGTGSATITNASMAVSKL